MIALIAFALATKDPIINGNWQFLAFPDEDPICGVAKVVLTEGINSPGVLGFAKNVEVPGIVMMSYQTDAMTPKPESVYLAKVTVGSVVVTTDAKQAGSEHQLVMPLDASKVARRLRDGGPLKLEINGQVLVDTEISDTIAAFDMVDGCIARKAATVNELSLGDRQD